MDKRITTKEAARLLGVSTQRIHQLIASGKLRGQKDGRDTRVSLASVNRRLKGRAK